MTDDYFIVILYKISIQEENQVGEKLLNGRQTWNFF